MTRYQWVLVVMVVAIATYEFLGLAGLYPPITYTVAAFPIGWVVVISGFCVWLSIHFLRAWNRRRPASRR